MISTSATRVSSSFRRWHRKLGLTGIPLVIILLCTGILLNHSDDLGLDRIPLPRGLLNLVYGIPPSEAMVGFSAAGHWFTDRGNSLMFNSTPFAECDQPLKGAVAEGAFVIALCNDSLYLVTLEGQLVERLAEPVGLPQHLLQIGSLLEASDADYVVLEGESEIWKLNLESLVSTKVTGTVATVNWSKPTEYPNELAKEINSDLLADDINVERLILDIHAGRVLGTFGVLLVDFVAVLMAILALSGFLMWVRKR
jgi:hypothetical protein